MAPASWNDQSSPLDALGRLPTCRTAANVATVSTPRELRITWNTNAVCNVGVAVADERGYFAKRNLKVQKINFARQPINCSSCLRAARLTLGSAWP